MRILEQNLQACLEEKQEIEKKSHVMASLMTSLDIENDTQKHQIQELEQFVILLSSALTSESGSNNNNEAELINQFAS